MLKNSAQHRARSVSFQPVRCCCQNPRDDLIGHDKHQSLIGIARGRLGTHDQGRCRIAGKVFNPAGVYRDFASAQCDLIGDRPENVVTGGFLRRCYADAFLSRVDLVAEEVGRTGIVAQAEVSGVEK